jgi:hypothetical protein
MTDDQQIRALLTRAAELPDTIQPSVAPLVQSARRKRRLHVALTMLCLAAVTAAAFTIPSVLKGQWGPVRSLARPGPVTARELVHSRWNALPSSPLGSRSGPILASTGNGLIELGGTRNGETQRNGAVFDATRQQWRRIAEVPSSVGLKGAVFVWTGRLFVTSGKVAGLYDPGHNQWTTTALPTQMAGHQLFTPVWTGRSVVLAGISELAKSPMLAVAAYNVADKTWRMITPHLPRRHEPGAVAMVATRHRVILWSMWSRSGRTSNGGAIYSGVDVLALRDGKWTPMTGNWPQHRVVGGAAFASFQILIPPGQFWCGPCPAPFSEAPAKFADAGSLALTTIPNSPLVTQPLIQPPIWLWNGRTVLAADESGYSTAAPGGRLGHLAVYGPWSHRWYLLPNAPGRPALAAPPILATEQLLVLAQSGRLMALGKRS